MRFSVGDIIYHVSFDPDKKIDQKVYEVTKCKVIEALLDSLYFFLPIGVDENDAVLVEKEKFTTNLKVVFKTEKEAYAYLLKRVDEERINAYDAYYSMDLLYSDVHLAYAEAYASEVLKNEQR